MEIEIKEDEIINKWIEEINKKEEIFNNLVFKNEC